jgi:hypothetical protein
MLNKQQAMAAMDAHIMRVEAERKRRLERRTRRFTFLYPALNDVPPEEGEAIALRAGQHAARRWPLYAIAVLALIGIGSAILLPDDTLKSAIVLRVAAAVLGLEIFFGVIFYRRMRAFIAREVAAMGGNQGRSG